MTNGSGSSVPTTTAQRLGAILKSSRDIMRKDKGLSGELDRIPVLTWILFLKFLDDMESLREEEARLAGEKFEPAIEPPYRWRDWASKEDGITGDELIAFINQEECRRPDGSRGPGLFMYLRTLHGTEGGDRRDVIATVFKGAVNRMTSGYLLRDLINKVHGIHFTSSDEIHTLGNFYEAMLKEMRDAAGDSGEFYTPRAVVRFMVTVLDPKLGETVLDPACGTGGFLVEAFAHMEKQCKTAQQRRQLQQGSIFGNEAKPLPYLLAQMNLLLHGLETPHIAPGNSLAVALREIGDRDRVDVVLTNPPFGGEEERGILSNFPEDLQTAETTLLFLQLIMRKLRRGPRPGRAAVVVPNGTLYASGVAARVRRELLQTFNLHTVVRLPKGVFEPYADIPTNILFFDASGPTKAIWFYEHPLPPHRRVMGSPCYSQSDPLTYDEFIPLLAWWNERRPTEHAWSLTAADLLEGEANLDQRNPRANTSIVRPFDSFVDELARIHERAGRLLQSLQSLERIEKEFPGRPASVVKRALRDVARIERGKFPTLKTPPGPYPFVVTAAERRTADGFQFSEPAICIPMVSSTGHGHAAIHRIHYQEGTFAVANIMAAVLVRDPEFLLPKFLYYDLWAHKETKLVSLMSGTANTSLTIRDLEGVEITIPDPGHQQVVVTLMDELVRLSRALEGEAGAMRDIAQRMLSNSLAKLSAP